MSESCRLQIYTTRMHLDSSLLSSCIHTRHMCSGSLPFSSSQRLSYCGIYSPFCKFSFFLSYPFNHTNPFIDTMSPFSYHSVVLYCLNSQKYCLHIFSPSPTCLFLHLLLLLLVQIQKLISKTYI